jgi:YD repeat-containing protein
VRDGVNAVVTRYGYDNLFLVSVTDPKGQTYGFTHNALGWLTQRTDPLNHSELYAYDRDGQLRTWTNRRGQTITNVYDVLHRRTSKSGSNTASETWAYPNDTLLIATSPVAVDTFLSNRYGQRLQATTAMDGQNYKRVYRYTSAAALDSVIPSGGGITFQVRHYTWNTRRGMLTGIKLGPASAATTNIAMDHDGLPVTATLIGGDVVSETHNALHTTPDITTTASYSANVNRSAGFDAADRIQREVTSVSAGYQFSYDSLGRLIADSTLQSSGTPCNPLHTPPTDYGDGCTVDPSWTVSAFLMSVVVSPSNRYNKHRHYWPPVLHRPDAMCRPPGNCAEGCVPSWTSPLRPARTLKPKCRSSLVRRP